MDRKVLAGKLNPNTKKDLFYPKRVPVTQPAHFIACYLR